MKNYNVDDLRQIENYSFAIRTGIGRREYQQDNFYLAIGDGEVFSCLCDGMGGMNGGEAASRTAVEAIIEYFAGFAHTAQGEYNPYWIQDAVEAVDDIVYGLKDENGMRLEGGTTLLVLSIWKEKMYWASVGDSRIYIIRGNEIAQVTRDQIYAEQLNKQLKEGMITEDLYQSEMKEGDALISFIGMGGLTQLDIYDNGLSLEKGDIILLCSDGLYKTISDQEILNVVQESIPVDAPQVLVGDNLLKRVADRIENKINEYDFQNQDNYSLVLISKNI